MEIVARGAKKEGNVLSFDIVLLDGKNPIAECPVKIDSTGVAPSAMLTFIKVQTLKAIMENPAIAAEVCLGVLKRVI